MAARRDYIIGHQQHGLWCGKEGLEAQSEGGSAEAAADLRGGGAGVHKRVLHGRVGLGSIWAAPGAVRGLGPWLPTGVPDELPELTPIVCPVTHLQQTDSLRLPSLQQKSSHLRSLCKPKGTHSHRI